MHPITALMLVESIERERRQAAPRYRPQPRREHPEPSGTSHWNEMLRVYRLGFAFKE